MRAPSAIRSGTPLNGSVVGSGAATPTYAASTSSQFESALLKNRNLGQDILPSPGQPKRTESLYVTPGRGSTASGGGGGGGGGGMSKVSLLLFVRTVHHIDILHSHTFLSFYLSRDTRRPCTCVTRLRKGAASSLDLDFARLFGPSVSVVTST